MIIFRSEQKILQKIRYLTLLSSINTFHNVVARSQGLTNLLAKN